MLVPILAAGVSAAVAAGYQSMAPTGQWYGRTFTGIGKNSKHLALTYDDGPNDPHTFRLLEVLARHEVKATFFLIGRFVQQRPDIVRELAKAGHLIGNHTFTHPQLIFKTGAQVTEEVLRCRRAIADAVGEHSNLFRPPFGGRRPVTLRAVEKLGLHPVMWNVTGYDWNAPSAKHIEAKVSSQAKGGNVILLHDGGHKMLGADRSATIEASNRLIARYQEDGYEFVTVASMMASAGH
jgi:peptidoglycan-N-acetylglucosamine deacetylase